MAQKPISRDKIERQKFKDRLNSKVELSINPPAPPVQKLPQSVLDRRQKEAQQRLEIQAKVESVIQQAVLQDQLEQVKKQELDRKQQELALTKRQEEEAKASAASLAEQERLTARAGVRGQLEKAAKADSERLEAMRVKSIAILEGKRRLNDDAYNKELDLEIGLVNRRILERRLKL